MPPYNEVQEEYKSNADKLINEYEKINAEIMKTVNEILEFIDNEHKFATEQFISEQIAGNIVKEELWKGHLVQLSILKLFIIN